MKRSNVLQSLTVLFVFSQIAWGGVPRLLNFQGVLKDGSGNPVANGPYFATFRIWDAAAGGTTLWVDTQTVVTNSGLFNAVLGRGTPVPDSVFVDTVRYLGVQIFPDPEMTPRERLVSVGYSYRVNSVDGAAGGTITGKLSIGPGHINTGANAFVAGESNTASGDNSTVGGGIGNTASGYSATIAGGQVNEASGAQRATVGGGAMNTASGYSATIAGGSENMASGQSATIGGGQYDTASAFGATVGGGNRNLAAAFAAAIAGGQYNKARGQFSVVSGGGGFALFDSNQASGDHSAVGGGRGNVASGFASAVRGGQFNKASDFYAAVGGGTTNTAGAEAATVGGGRRNSASAGWATVGGGNEDTASGLSATVGGGGANLASGDYATVPGGAFNTAAGAYSFAAGLQAKADHDGSFVWSDLTSPAGFASTAADQFLINASGGVGIGTNSPQQKLHVFSSGANVGFALEGGSSGRARLGLLPGGVDNGELGFKNDLMIGTISDATLVMASEKVRIRSNGTVGIGTSSPQDYLDVYGRVRARHRAGTYAGFIVADEAGTFQGGFVLNGTVGPSIYATGTGYAVNVLNSNGNVGIGTAAPTEKLHVVGNICATGTITSCSDARFKRNVQSIEGSLDKIEKLRGVTYRWNREQYPQFAEGNQIGFVAQEVRKVLPEVVSEGSDGTLSVDYGRFSVVLLEAVKEQQKEISELKAALEKLQQEKK